MPQKSHICSPGNLANNLFFVFLYLFQQITRPSHEQDRDRDKSDDKNEDQEKSDKSEKKEDEEKKDEEEKDEKEDSR